MAIAKQLVRHHGILTKEMLTREEVAGGFAGLYPVLKAMEEAGKVRRGYFAAGLGAAQFAAPGGRRSPAFTQTAFSLRCLRYPCIPNCHCTGSDRPCEPMGQRVTVAGNSGIHKTSTNRRREDDLAQRPSARLSWSPATAPCNIRTGKKSRPRKFRIDEIGLGCQHTGARTRTNSKALKFVAAD